MLELLGCLLVGVGCGWLLRRRQMRGLGKLLMVVIALLLFVLGGEVALSQSEMNHLFVVVGSALVVALFATLGSLVGAWLLGKGKR